MILELKKSCLETIERALQNINQFKTQWYASLAKPGQQKLNSVQNDMQLLKDNFTLIATKVVRLQSKCNERQNMVQKIQHKYRASYQEICQAYKILEVKHEKLGKQLNFIRFSNNNLRKELQCLQAKQRLNDTLKKGIEQIQKLVSSNGENLVLKINNIISSIQTQNLQGAGRFEKQFEARPTSHTKDSYKANHHRVQEVSQFSLQKPPIFQQAVLKQERLNMNSCQLKNERQNLKTKKKIINNKQGQQVKQSMSTDKKKRSQLARLVEQQGRLAKINERYLSTDIF